MPTAPHSHRVARNVRAEMARAGKNQQDIASHLGISQQSVSRRMSGSTPFTIDELAAIAGLLGVRLTELVREVAA